MKRFDFKSGIVGAVAGVGMVMLVGAADSGQSDDGRYHLSDPWTSADGAHGVYRLDSRTGETLEIVGAKGTSVPQTEIHPR